jgi:xylan 1,4-beta-xylosidase
MKRNIIYILSAISLLALSSFKRSETPKTSSICNPMNLSYQFSLWENSRREAADPTMILFKGEYYLFASKTGGYFHSTDMVNWKLITPDILPLDDYAPTVVVMKDTLYFMASNPNIPPKIFKTADPKSGRWSIANSSFPIAMIDPDLFLDDDGRLYFYYGCSDVNPIYGIELDTKTLNPIGKSVELFNSNKKVYGWERFGDSNEKEDNPWIEGAWMTKHNGKYYLQYACPGTQFKSYCDGLYVSNSPLGPFKLAEHNPCSYKPGGFIAGAGHSSTFQDKYGNYWHISSMTISQKHIFERRLGLFPTFFDNDGEMFVYTAFGDFPMKVPNKKISGPDELSPKWMLLSYNKPVEVSSEEAEHPKSYASDEEIRTYWSAKTGNKGEWLTLDLQKKCEVNAVQINFAENETTVHGRDQHLYFSYLLEYSLDNKTWKTLTNKTNNTTDVPHDYIELHSPVKARYIKLTNYHVPDGTFALAGLRIFGNGGGMNPPVVENLKVTRSETDPCVVKLNWTKTPNTVGYNIRFGSKKDKLYHNYQVFNVDSLTIRSLNANQEYYFSIDAFNENGITKGKRIFACENNDIKRERPQVAYLTAYMKGNDETHLYYALSEKDYIFKEINGGKPILSASFDDKLIRDPMIFRDQKGIYHLVATVSWTHRPFTIWDSKDLIHWENERLVDVAPENATKTWAPEIAYDSENDSYFVYWTGEVNNVWNSASIYYTTTKDFKTFSKSQILFKDNVGILDANIIKVDGVYNLIYRKTGIWIATSKNATGLYTNPRQFSAENVEGPYVFPLRDTTGYGIVWDYYGGSAGFGLLTSPDFKNWTHITNQNYPYYNSKVEFPNGIRHGSIMGITQKELNDLKKIFTTK